MPLTHKEIDAPRRVGRELRVEVRPPQPGDMEPYTALARRSRRFHAGLVAPARNAVDFAALLRRAEGTEFAAFLLIRRSDGALLGAANLSQIFRGGFQSAYLGYWIGAPYANQGYMSEGLSLVLSATFGALRLHRVEANIQPQNLPSRRLVQALGFRLEGYSPRYLKIGGRWRDHERWALLREEWRGRGRRVTQVGGG
jgi:[ribosomal protein S5]-alanine N-acetyltransferase